jgi:hypothetical protein
MKMQFSYGIFDSEADHIIAMVRDHASLDSIVGTPCPACGAEMVVVFNDDGTGFSLNCKGDPLHITKQQEIDNPPPWWQQCYEEPTDTRWYWREWHSFDADGTLHMKISGLQADDVWWSGAMECRRDHRDHELWRWILNESGCTKDLIGDADFNELRAQYQNAK